MLAALMIGALVYWQWPAASPTPGPSNQPRVQQAPQQAAGSQSSLDVRLDALKEPAPEPSETGRNPFRFQPKPPPPPPPMPTVPTPTVVPPESAGPPQPPPPPPVPPIPLKFIGTLQGEKPGKVAIFSDGHGMPVYGREGEIVLGQYRIVTIGVESVVMEYADGKGRQTIPLRGQ